MRRRLFCWSSLVQLWTPPPFLTATFSTFRRLLADRPTLLLVLSPFLSRLFFSRLLSISRSFVYNVLSWPRTYPCAGPNSTSRRFRYSERQQRFRKVTKVTPAQQEVGGGRAQGRTSTISVHVSHAQANPEIDLVHSIHFEQLRHWST